jgi:PhnB protein
MSQLSISPYINFNGHAREAMEFYQAALGGELTLLSMGPEGGAPKPAGPDDAIMHAYLEADGAKIMGSDGMVEYPAKVGDNFAVALGGSDMERLTKAFEMLSAGGTVKQTLKQESWGDTFGWFEDKFGINWMVNITKSEG